MIAHKNLPLFAKIEKKIFQTQPVDVYSTVKAIRNSQEYESMQDIIDAVEEHEQQHRCYYKLKTKSSSPQCENSP